MPELTPSEADLSEQPLDEAGLVTFLEESTNCELEESSLSLGWAGVQAAIWNKEDDEFCIPALNMHLMGLALDSQAHSDMQFTELSGPRYTIVEPGRLWFIPAGNRATLAINGRCRVLHIMLDRAFVLEHLEDRLTGDPTKVTFQGFCGQTDGCLVILARTILALLKHSPDKSESVASYLAGRLAERLITSSSTAYVRDKHMPSLTSSQMNQAIDFLEANLVRNFEASEVARYVGLPESYFEQAFANDIGSNLLHFKSERRVDAIRTWLDERHTSASAETIAQTIGFVTVEHMNKAFLEHIGTTFEEYREGLRYRPALLSAKR